MDQVIPAHVPPELVVDIDIYAMPTDCDAQQTWRHFQNKKPLAFSPHNGGHWVLTCGEDLPRFFLDTRHFSSRQIAIPDPGDDARLLPIQADPPIHSKYRKNIQLFFTQPVVDALDPDIRTLTAELIEEFRARGECEFVSEFSLKLPLTIFLRMVGLPLDDRLYLRSLVEPFSSEADLKIRRQAYADLYAYLGNAIDERIATPRDDIITRITQSAIDGRPYTRDEMLATCSLLLSAGLDTVANIFGFIVMHLARHPEHRVYIRNHPERMNAIVQEFLRRFAVPNMARVVLEDVTYKGVEMKAGDRIMLAISLFNMDPAVAHSPDEVDFEREARNIAFGAGPHSCAGALLARREIAIFLEEWLTRIPDFEVDANRPPKTWAAPVNRVAELWLRWPAHQPRAGMGAV